MAMPVTDAVIEYVLDQLSSMGDVGSRKMFGGAGLYRDGTMFGLIADDVAYLKVDDSNRPDFIDAGSGPFKPYADKPMTMSYYEAPADGMDDSTLLCDWAKGAFAAAKRAAAKKKPKKKK